VFNIGPQELFWIFMIVLFLFGAKRIPEIGRSIGKGISEFKKGMKEVESELSASDKPAPPTTAEETKKS